MRTHTCKGETRKRRGSGARARDPLIASAFTRDLGIVFLLAMDATAIVRMPLEALLLEEATCYVCHIVPLLPWTTCPSGHHFVCTPCARKLGHAPSNTAHDFVFSCSLCNVRGPLRRASHLEKVAQHISLRAPCPHMGCDYHTTVDNMVDHARTCVYMPWRCPVSNPCKWTGPTTLFVEHVKHVHAHKCYRTLLEGGHHFTDFAMVPKQAWQYGVMVALRREHHAVTILTAERHADVPHMVALCVSVLVLDAASRPVQHVPVAVHFRYTNAHTSLTTQLMPNYVMNSAVLRIYGPNKRLVLLDDTPDSIVTLTVTDEAKRPADELDAQRPAKRQKMAEKDDDDDDLV
jgi:hypothetical protein